MINKELSFYIIIIPIFVGIFASVFSWRKVMLLKRILVIGLIISMTVCGLGLGSNIFVVYQNDGKMPVYNLNKSLISNDKWHIEASENTKYSLLSDRFYNPFIPKGMYSIGDIFLAVGGVLFFSLMAYLLTSLVIMCTKERNL